MLQMVGMMEDDEEDEDDDEQVLYRGRRQEAWIGLTFVFSSPLPPTKQTSPNQVLDRGRRQEAWNYLAVRVSAYPPSRSSVPRADPRE